MKTARFIVVMLSFVLILGAFSGALARTNPKTPQPEPNATVVTSGLQAVLDSASTDKDTPTEIQLGADLEGVYKVKEGTYVVLDLNGKKLTRTDYGQVIEVYGNLTVNDTAGGGEVHGQRGISVYNGSLIINGGTVTGTPGLYASINVYGNYFEMNGGKIVGFMSIDDNTTAVFGNNAVAEEVKIEDGNATFNAGTFDGIRVDGGSAVVNGGTCNLIRALYGNATIYGGEIYNTYIYNGSITVYGGTLGEEKNIDDKTQFGVNLPEDNTVAAEPQVTTKDSDVVLTVTPEEGNAVYSIVVNYREDQTIIPVQDAENPLKYTFKMPKAPVEVVVNYKPAITITAASGSWVYDGQAHGNAEVTVTAGALKEGDTLAATASGSVTNVADTAQGNNPVAEGYKVMRGETDVTAEYAITAAAGTLEIEPREITITAASESWVYDGQAHGNAEVTVTRGELAEGDALEAAATGSVTNVADTAQDNNPVAEGYRVTRGETDVTANYSITAVAGSLGITKAENPAVIAENASVTAGGEAIDLSACVTGAEGEVTYEITGEANGCTLEGSILTPGTAEGSCTVSVTVAGDDNRTGGAGRITVQISPAPQESEPEASSKAETSPEESVASSVAPQTGDAGTNPIVLALIAAVSLAGAAIVIRRRRAE